MCPAEVLKQLSKVNFREQDLTQSNWYHCVWYIEVVGALISVLLIWVVTAVLVGLAIQRVRNPGYDIEGITMVITASVGILFNIVWVHPPYLNTLCLLSFFMQPPMSQIRICFTDVFFSFFCFFRSPQKNQTTVLGNGWTDFHETFTKR